MSINKEIYMDLVNTHRNIAKNGNSKGILTEYNTIIAYECRLLQKIRNKEKEIRGKNYLQEGIILKDIEKIEKSLKEKEELLETFKYSVGNGYVMKIRTLKHDQELLKAIDCASIADRYNMTIKDLERIIK